MRLPSSSESPLRGTARALWLNRAPRFCDMSAESLIRAYVVSLLAALSVLAVYSEIRSRRFRPAREKDRIFRCERCGSVYTDDADVDRSRCSQCGNLNEPIQF
jgi:DNA-directed RNA polymerase subunit RPC12/RpoP